MPIQPINFLSGLPIQGNPTARGMAPAVNDAQEILSKYLAAEKSKAELPYAGQMAKSTAEYKQAMANYLMSPNQALRHLSGLGKTYIEPQVVNALLKSRGINTANMPNEGFTYEQPEGQQDISTSGSSEDSEEGGIPDIYGLQRQKISTDTDTRKRALFAKNIEKTIGYINPDHLSKYSGVKGTLNKIYETGKSSMGHASDDYKAYVKSMKAAQFLAKQVRQFYGASITPEMDSQLQSITNPESWKNDPELTKDIFNQTISILGAETGTYTGALKSTRPYGKEEKTKQSKNEPLKDVLKKEAAKFKGEAIRVISPDGKTGTIPQEDLEMALTQGYKRV